jgi:hypothetical protein
MFVGAIKYGFSAEIVLLCPPYGGFFQFYSIIGHRGTFALQMNQAASGSACHGFGAADDIHLREDRFYVRFHRAFADE